MIRQNDKRRQIFVDRSQSVTYPATGAWKTRYEKSRCLLQRRSAMHARLTHHIVNKGNIIGNSPKRCNGIAQHLAAFAIGLEVPYRLLPRPQSILERFYWFPKVAGLAVEFDQIRFEIEKVYMTRRSCHKELHDPLRASWVVKARRVPWLCT